MTATVENFTFGKLACVKSPFDLSIDFDKDLGNPEIYRGFLSSVCNECGTESFLSIEKIRCLSPDDLSIMRMLCEDCALEICGYEYVV